jgi:hypothetical protein
MKATEMLNKVKDLLSGEATKSEDIQENPQEEVKLEQQSLVNGTVLEAELFESGKEVFIVTEDEKVALPLGDYELEDGRILKVEEEGMIASIGEVSEVESEEEAKEEEVEATEEAPVKKKIVSEITEEVYASKEELNELSSKIEELKTLLESKADIQEKEELAEEPVRIKHSPEATSKKDLNFFKPKGKFTTIDRVLANMAKFNK